jgi:hypothetical protein
MLTNKRIIWTLLAACLAVGSAWAQTPDAPKAEPKKKAAKSASKTEIKSTAKQMAAGIEAAEAALTPEELAIAERVLVGKVPCELGNFVTLSADPKMPGYFDVSVNSVKNQKFHMFPVVSATGAIRLEDRRNGAVWLQLGNKSMLMSQKLGLRLADACVTPEQAVVQAAMDKAPPVNLLEPAKPKALPASAAVASVVTTTTVTTTTTTYALPAAVPASGAAPMPAAATSASAPAVVVVPVPAAAVASAAAGAVVVVPAAPAPGASAPAATVVLVPDAPASAPKK